MTTVGIVVLVLLAQVPPPQTLPGRGQATPPRPTAPGAVSGRIVDAKNKPVAGVEVRTMRRIVLNGVIQLVSYGELAETDADGRYRLANRQPGEYLVVANPYTRDAANMRMHVRRTPAAATGPDGRSLGYVITYFPGSAEEREGRTITVETTEVADVNFSMARRPVFNVTGRVELASRSPVVGRGSGPIATLTVVPTRIADQMAGLNLRSIGVGVDGAFEVSELSDGEYRLSYRGGGSWAEGTVIVAGAPPSPVVMSLRPDVVVSGRIEFKGATPAPALDRPAPGAMPPAFAELRPAVISAGASFVSMPFQPDGTFSSRAGGPGPFVLRARLPAPGCRSPGSSTAWTRSICHGRPRRRRRTP